MYLLTLIYEKKNKKQKNNGPVSCMQLINAMQWLRQLLRMYFFVLFIGHGLQSLSICPWYHNAGKINENDLRLFEQWYRGCAIMACLHCKNFASLSRSKGTSLPLHSMCMLLSIYSQPSITCGGFSSLRHALHHHCDITQNMRWLYLLWVTYMYLNSCIKHNCIFSSCLQLCFSWLLSLHQVSCGIAHVGSGICSFVAIQSL